MLSINSEIKRAGELRKILEKQEETRQGMFKKAGIKAHL